MGADGHLVAVTRADWDAAHPEVKPEDIGLYTGTILGVQAVWGYAGDNLMGCGHNGWNNYGDEFRLTYDGSSPNSKATSEDTEKRRAALKWFDAHAEWTEVWT